jgi:transposase
MMTDLERWHLSQEAVYELLDGTLGPEARSEAELHLRTCPECTHHLRRAQRLFGQLKQAPQPRMARDLSPNVVAAIQARHAARASLRWTLATEAVAAIIALAFLGPRLGHWLEVLRAGSGYVQMRQHGLELVGQVASWFSPFLDLGPSFPARLDLIRIPIPDLGGPMEGWVGLAIAAIALGLVGNALLLRSANGAARSAIDQADGWAGRKGSGGHV